MAHYLGLTNLKMIKFYTEYGPNHQLTTKTLRIAHNHDTFDLQWNKGWNSRAREGFSCQDSEGRDGRRSICIPATERWCCSMNLASRGGSSLGLFPELATRWWDGWISNCYGMWVGAKVALPQKWRMWEDKILRNYISTSGSECISQTRGTSLFLKTF